MKKVTAFTIAVFALGITSSGCMRAISKELRAQVQENIDLVQVREDPSNFMGKMVIWGGVIVETKNLKEGTLVEIVQKPISVEQRPRNIDQSGGRYLALYKGYLNAAIYSAGRDVTVAGRLKEMKTKPLGEIEYSYPVISAEEVYLWPPRTEKKYPEYPFWFYPGYYHYPHRLDPWYW